MKTRHRPVITKLPKVIGTAPKTYADDRSRVQDKRAFDENYERIFMKGYKKAVKDRRKPSGPKSRF